MIRAVTTTIYCLGCYRTNNTLISRIGLGGNYSYSHGIVVLEEAYEFDQKTYSALREAIRGVDKMTGILRTNPWLANNWFVKRCFSVVPLEEKVMLEGSGNIFKEVGREVYHYMRGDVNTPLPQTQRDYLEEVTINNPMRARRVSYGLPGTSEGMVFADIVHKIKTGFELKRGEEFSAGVDVGHVKKEKEKIDERLRKIRSLTNGFFGNKENGDTPPNPPPWVSGRGRRLLLTLSHLSLLILSYFLSLSSCLLSNSLLLSSLVLPTPTGRNIKKTKSFSFLPGAHGTL